MSAAASPTTSPNANTALRQRSLAVLAKANVAELEAMLDRIGGAPRREWLRPPETGTVMVQGRAGGTGRRFHLGEMTATRCALRLEDGTVGHGYVKGRDQRLVELVALFDALLQREHWRGPIAAEVIEPLDIAQRERRARRARKANATRVDFFTLVRGDNKT